MEHGAGGTRRTWSNEFLRDIIADVEPINPSKTQCGSRPSNDVDKEGENEPGLRRVLLKLTGALHDGKGPFDDVWS